MLSIIIPSRNEQFLSQTVDDLFAKARGEIEVIVVLDEKEQELAPRPNLIIHKKVGPPGMKTAINQGINLAQGEFIMKTDGHCMFGEGFDTILSAECQENWIMIPRRFSLEPTNWSIRTFRPTIDYEYVVFPYNPELHTIKTGGKWHSRAAERQHILIDETMAMQGSCWFTTKKHYRNIDGLEFHPETGDDFILESEELTNKTWLSGGKCMVNKKTFYAHLHKGNQYGRGYFLNSRSMKRHRRWHIDYWMHDRWPKAIYKMEWLVNHFMPIPHWPLDWQDPKYENQWRIENGLEPLAIAKL